MVKYPTIMKYHTSVILLIILVKIYITIICVPISLNLVFSSLKKNQ